jgi:hypothetical protein
VHGVIAAPAKEREGEVFLKPNIAATQALTCGADQVLPAKGAISLKSMKSTDGPLQPQQRAAARGRFPKILFLSAALTLLK